MSVPSTAVAATVVVDTKQTVVVDTKQTVVVTDTTPAATDAVTSGGLTEPQLYAAVSAKFAGPLTAANALNLVSIAIAVAEDTKLAGTQKKLLVVDCVNGFVERSNIPTVEKDLLKTALTILLPGAIDSIVDAANKRLAGACGCC